MGQVICIPFEEDPPDCNTTYRSVPPEPELYEPAHHGTVSRHLALNVHVQGSSLQAGGKFGDDVVR